ncbi:MAG: hypothetical protein MJZ89_02635 [Paludibacteraceae bacterium]|nr:hypothetical protein [Paludibacteraceae bacterium]
MKTNKFFMGAMLLGAALFTSCGDKYTLVFENNSQYTVNNNTYQGGGDTPQELPDVPETDKMVPEAGKICVILNLADGLNECNGIGLKGCLNGSDWSGENTYIGAESSQVSRDEAIRFVSYKAGTPYYMAVFNMGEGGINAKVCQFFQGDSGWQGQATDVTVDTDLTTLILDVDFTLSGEGQFALAAGAPAGVLVLNVGGFQKSECAAAQPVATEAWIKCAGNGWTPAQMTATGTAGVFTYESTITDVNTVGANIGLTEDNLPDWYDLGNAESHGLAEGDAVIYTFTSTSGSEGTVTIAKK